MIKYLILIPTIYFLIGCAKIDIGLKECKEVDKSIMKALGIFSDEERIEIEKDIVRQNRKGNIVIILNYILTIIVITMVIITIMYWDYKPLFTFTRVSIAAMFSFVIINLYMKKKEKS